MSCNPNPPIGFIENRPFDEIAVGDSAELVRTLTLQDIDAFAVVSGDVNPAHVDPEFARQDIFHEVIAHGMWGGALISNALGTQLPGPGTIYLSQSLKFLKPVGVGDTVTVRVTVAEKDAARKRLTLDCLCTNGGGKTVIAGQAVVIAPEQKIRRPRVTMPDLVLHRHGAAHDRLLAQARTIAPLPTAVVHPCDGASLEGALQARDLDLIVPLLVGPEARIRAAAGEAGLDLKDTQVVDSAHSHASAARAVALVHEGRAEALMKGALHTDEIMSAVVARTGGLRSERRMSHVFVMDVPSYPKPLLITDAAINIAPDLQTKADIVQNAIDLAHAIGIAAPRVAILSAVETITARLRSTVDAGALCKMADRGQITGGTLDGPLAFDNAISSRAAASKGIRSEVAGQADILVVPDLEAGNMVCKQLMYLAGAESAGVVLGAQVPIILTSRADGSRTRIASAAIAALYSGAVPA
ncbi:bifunctional enoyl-CoA hydratase/phosphate acetyltransferase [Denitrobaculum tricleocarpae]|uniref:Bifunctional enoyl-CoA hydratase/phosphate acetyltransferase n=1 Tax=Denitrobaculum tricleocarpae TaxID=2591009 RepID=A0A545U2E4_9PROT|nr:bifunctional enoyl-CoA hydratase/phosphate acetyltransferase [Denitrobaculum tricleocarpae]TQV83628.1 bifunctional enoyl-CoA hydratase/phosphate acetyltransferase [Denitrobaculum tricleocarpae]